MRLGDRAAEVDGSENGEDERLKRCDQDDLEDEEDDRDGKCGRLSPAALIETVMRSGVNKSCKADFVLPGIGDIFGVGQTPR